MRNTVGICEDFRQQQPVILSVMIRDQTMLPVTISLGGSRKIAKKKPLSSKEVQDVE
jgi:hypothetical protein